MFEKLLPDHKEYDNCRLFQCKLCKSKYSCKSGVKEHTKYRHNPKYQKVTCNYCHKIYAHYKTLRAHILRRHSRFHSNDSNVNNSSNSKEEKSPKKSKGEYRSRFCSTLNLD